MIQNKARDLAISADKSLPAAYTLTSSWRNRHQFIVGRQQITTFLSAKRQREHDYRLIKELWAHSDDGIAVRFAYEWRDDEYNCYRAYGNENWQFDERDLMAHRHTSINDLAIDEGERLLHWPLGRRPDGYAGLSDLGL